LFGAVEAFDNENFAGAELGDFGVRVSSPKAATRREQSHAFSTES
jgi:hypothetical protein